LSIVRRHKKPTEVGDENATRVDGRLYQSVDWLENSELLDIKIEKTRQRWAGFLECFGKRP
jgi:hypothetical protein